MAAVLTKQPKHNESEALPAAETAELELGQPSKFASAPRVRRKFGQRQPKGQRSVFCKGAATPAAKAGHRNPDSVLKNAAYAAVPSGAAALLCPAL